MLLGRLIVACVSMTMLASASALAAEPPDNVRKDVQDAAAECRSMHGKPNTEAMLTVADLNGDAAEDWIVDYAKLRCEGIPNPFCGTRGCGLKIYLWTEGSAWKLVFDDTVRSYRRSRAGSRAVLDVTYGGSECGKVNYEDCRFVYEYRRDRMVRRR